MAVSSHRSDYAWVGSPLSFRFLLRRLLVFGGWPSWPAGESKEKTFG